MSFRNDYLSVSRMKKFEQCPRAFELHYVLGHRSRETNVATAFGTLLHAVLESLFRWVTEEEHEGLLPEDLAQTYYREHWRSSGLADLGIYQEGLGIVRAYVRKHPPVDHRNVLGVEVPFDLQLQEFRVEGRIDRIDKLDDESVEVIDFKSNRVLFTPDELASDLQMSVYGLAVKKLFPWAKNVRFAFDMLRHDVRQTTTRTEQELRDAADYIVLLGRQSESGQYPARVNANCGYCDHRGQCLAYQDAVSRRVERVALGNDLAKLVAERERVSLVAKNAYGRMKDIDETLRPHLENKGDMCFSGVTLRLSTQDVVEYPVEQTVEKLVKLSGKTRAQVLESVATILPKRLEREIEALPSAKKHLARAEVESLGSKAFGPARIQSTKAKGKA